MKNDPDAKVAKLVITSAALEYDADKDTVITKNEDELNRLVEEHCKAKGDRDNKKDMMKNRILEKVRDIERKRRGMRRGRSDEDDSDTDGGSMKSLRLSHSLPVSKA